MTFATAPASAVSAVILAGRHVATLAVAPGTLAHAEPDQQDEQMPQRIDARLVAVHVVLEELRAIPGQRIRRRLALIGARHGQRRRLGLLEPGRRQGEAQGHAGDISGRRLAPDPARRNSSPARLWRA